MNKEEYKGIFVFAEQREGEIKNVAFELIGKARELAEAVGEDVTALLLGDQVSPLAQSLIEAGADRVLIIDSPELKDYLTEPYTQAVSPDPDLQAGSPAYRSIDDRARFGAACLGTSKDRAYSRLYSAGRFGRP